MNSRLPRLTPLLIILAAAALVAPRIRRGAADEPGAAASKSSVAGVYEAAAASSPGSQIPTTTAKEPSHSQRESSSVGDKLLVQAANQLERRNSISARLRQQISIAGSQLYGVGSYWQQGSGEDLRVRLELQIAGQDAKLLQVSNSRFLWVERRLPTGRTVTRIDLRQLRADPALAASSLDDIRPGQASWSTLQSELVAHCGGLPSLLAALGENFSFLPPQAMRLAAQPTHDSQQTSIPVFAVVGHWKPEKLSALLALDSRPSTLDSVPDRLPQEILLLVGQADLFPYRIEYRRQETPLVTNNDAPPIPYQLSANPMVVLELTDVAFDVPIAAGQFDYAPGDADWIDQTAALLERLRHAGGAKVAGRSGLDGSAGPTR